VDIAAAAAGIGRERETKTKVSIDSDECRHCLPPLSDVINHSVSCYCYSIVIFSIIFYILYSNYVYLTCPTTIGELALPPVLQIIIDHRIIAV
jgi:hypothetical protein